MDADHAIQVGHLHLQGWMVLLSVNKALMPSYVCFSFRASLSMADISFIESLSL